MTSSSKRPEINYLNRMSGKREVEKVYGDWFIKFLYCTQAGKKFGAPFTSKFFSKFYGSLQDLSYTSKKVKPFVSQFDIQLEDYEAGSLGGIDQRESYKSFNEFFIRKFKKGKRSFISQKNLMPAFAEARYFGHESVDDKTSYPVKGHFLKAKDLLSDSPFSKFFEGGPLLIARLCPVDYHRYHYPDNGKILEHYPIRGTFDSVNPFALKFKEEIFIQNERYVSILETENFGKVAYIEVGAICVGKIVQTHAWQNPFLRGEEKGYFLFGGSTVILLGEAGKWKPSLDILKNTQEGLETYIHLGQEVATKI